MGKKKKDNGAEDFAAETQEDQDTLPTDGENILDDGGIAPGTQEAPAAEESDTKERDDAALENPAVAPVGDVSGSAFSVGDVSDESEAAPEGVDEAHDRGGDDAAADAAKPPEATPANDPVGTAVSGTAVAGDSAEPAYLGSDVVPTPNTEPQAAAPADEGKSEDVEGEPGEDTGSATAEIGAEPIDDEKKPAEPSTDSSASLPEGSESDEAAEPAMPALGEVHPEAKPIEAVAGNKTMGQFKDAGNLLTEGLASLREIEHKLESLGEEAKARLAHLRTKASEALAALEAWFSRS